MDADAMALNLLLRLPYRQIEDGEFGPAQAIVAAALRRAHEAGLERAMKAACPYCREGAPFASTGHWHKGPLGVLAECKAAAIRALKEARRG